jgi:hypothetical protein
MLREIESGSRRSEASNLDGLAQLVSVRSG